MCPGCYCFPYVDMEIEDPPKHHKASAQHYKRSPQGWNVHNSYYTGYTNPGYTAVSYPAYSYQTQNVSHNPWQPELCTHSRADKTHTDNVKPTMCHYLPAGTALPADAASKKIYYGRSTGQIMQDAHYAARKEMMEEHQCVPKNPDPSKDFWVLDPKTCRWDRRPYYSLKDSTGKWDKLADGTLYFERYTS